MRLACWLANYVQAHTLVSQPVQLYGFASCYIYTHMDCSSSGFFLIIVYYYTVPSEDGLAGIDLWADWCSSVAYI